MRAALVKSAKDAQIRDSFNKESMALIKSDAMFKCVYHLNTLERVLPRNASKLHSAIIMNSEGSILLLNFEVLEIAGSGFRYPDEFSTEIHQDEEKEIKSQVDNIVAAGSKSENKTTPEQTVINEDETTEDKEVIDND